MNDIRCVRNASLEQVVITLYKVDDGNRLAISLLSSIYYVQTISDLLEQLVASLLASTTLLQDGNRLFQDGNRLTSCEV